MSTGIDYEDVKAKIVENEGYDMHDFGIFDDRASTLWRKPYVDGAVRELTSGNNKSVEELRRSIEEMILAKRARKAQLLSKVRSGYRTPPGFANCWARGFCARESPSPSRPPRSQALSLPSDMALADSGTRLPDCVFGC